MTNLTTCPYNVPCCNARTAPDHSLLVILLLVGLVWLVLRLRRSRSRRMVTRSMVVLVAVSLVVLAATVGYRNGQRARWAARVAVGAGEASPSPMRAARPSLVVVFSSADPASAALAAALDSWGRTCTGTVRCVLVDAVAAPDTAALYRTKELPSVILYDGSGAEVFRREATCTEQEIRARCKALGWDLGNGDRAPGP